MTRTAEFIIWVVLAIAPDNEVRFTDIDGTGYRIYAWEHALDNHHELRAINVWSTPPGGEPTVLAIVYEFNPFKPFHGWARYENYFDRQGRLLDQ